MFRSIFLAGIFELGHFSEALLGWRANHFLPVEWVGITLILMNIGQFLAAYPLGKLSLSGPVTDNE